MTTFDLHRSEQEVRPFGQLANVCQEFHARHTFGTTGAKISLFFGAGEHIMGDKVVGVVDEPIEFQLAAKAELNVPGESGTKEAPRCPTSASRPIRETTRTT